MIISASRRTDIPAFYADWLLARLREGFAMTRNPMNAHQVRRVSLLPQDVDALVLWSKNPRPLLDHIDALSAFPYYLQYTLNAYGPEIEPGLPPLRERLDTFLRWAEAIGPQCVRWRYDPILLSDAYPLDFHLEQMERLASALHGATEQVYISFMDDYVKIRKRIAALGVRSPREEEMCALAPQLSAIARANGLRIVACCEAVDLSPYGVERARCIDGALIEAIGGRLTDPKPDHSQRPHCGCLASVDIGAYNCCAHHCVYCYANAGEAAVARNCLRHDSAGPMLLGD